MYSCQVLRMHVHAMVPGQRVYTAKSDKGRERVPDAVKWDTTLREKHRSPRIARGWRKVENPPERNGLLRNPKGRPGSTQRCPDNDDTYIYKHTMVLCKG
jgi:hypothetical protein